MQRNILEYLEDSCSLFPDKVVFADDKAEVTYDRFVRQSRYVGAYLLEKVLKIGRASCRERVSSPV